MVEYYVWVRTPVEMEAFLANLLFYIDTYPNYYDESQDAEYRKLALLIHRNDYRPQIFKLETVYGVLVVDQIFEEDIEKKTRAYLSNFKDWKSKEMEMTEAWKAIDKETEKWRRDNGSISKDS